MSWHHTKSRWSNVQAEEEWKEGLWWGKEIIINELHETIRRHSVLLVFYSAVMVARVEEWVLSLMLCDLWILYLLSEDIREHKSASGPLKFCSQLRLHLQTLG